MNKRRELAGKLLCVVSFVVLVVLVPSFASGCMFLSCLENRTSMSILLCLYHGFLSRFSLASASDQSHVNFCLVIFCLHL